MKVFVQRLTSAGYTPVRATEGSLGYDLSVVGDPTMEPHSTVLLHTGLTLAAKLPDGIAMTLWPRSSLFYKKGVMIGNSIGLIDQDYAGEIKILAYNTTNQLVSFQDGERIAQLVFLPVALPEVIMVEEALEELHRGGFGSTGA